MDFEIQYVLKYRSINTEVGNGFPWVELCGSNDLMSQGSLITLFTRI